MTTIKTAISLPQDVFEAAEALARRMQVSRSRLFALAVEDFMLRHQNRDLLEQLNQAYPEVPDSAEQERVRRMRRAHRQIVEGEW